MNVNYHVLPQSVVLNFSGKTLSISSADNRYESVLDAIREDRLSDIPGLVDTKAMLTSSELDLRDGLLWLDNEALPEALSNRVLEFQRLKLPFEYLVKFARKLRLNPSYNSREQLFKFLEHNGHPITTEGNFIAYRGVTVEFKDKHTGKFDNSVGAVCEMPRDQVDDNPNNTCSRGLHVACYEYAKGFGSKTVEVEVDPRDVVCVPTDYNGTKMRTCKFKVVAVSENMNKDQLVDSSYEPTAEECTEGQDDPESDGHLDPIETVNVSDSSAIHWMEYNHDLNELTVMFHNGNEYEYEGVPVEVWVAFKAAKSKGRYFLNTIRDNY